MKIRHIILLILLSAFCLGVVAYSRWVRVYDLKTERAAARAAGIAISAEEFVRTPPPDARNAALEYNQLNELLKKAPLKADFLNADNSGGVAPEQIAQLKALVSSRQDVARLVHAAIAKPDAFWEHQWTAEELLPYLAQMRTAAKWLYWESLLLAREGRYMEAVEHQALGMRVARQAAQDPIIIAFLVSIASEEITLNGFRDILFAAGPNSAAAEAVLREIRTNPIKRDLGYYFEGEMLFGLTVMRQITSFRDLKKFTDISAEERPTRKGGSGWLIRWVIRDPSEAVYIHWMRQQILASRQPFEKRCDALNALQAKWNSTPRKKPSFIFASLVIPVFSNIGERERDLVSRRSAVEAAASVMGYRAQKGFWPQGLGDAVQPVPLDYRTGKPVNYQRMSDGFLVSTKALGLGDSPEQRRKEQERREIRYPVTYKREAAPPPARHWKLPPRPSFPDNPPMPPGPPR